MATMNSCSTNQPPQLEYNQTRTSSDRFATQCITHFDEGDCPPMIEETSRLLTLENSHTPPRSSSVRSCYPSQQIDAMT
jgi:hypothetical protein